MSSSPDQDPRLRILGMLLLAGPCLATGIGLLAHLILDPRAPVWILSWALAALGLGVALIAFLGTGTRRGAPDLERKRRLWKMRLLGDLATGVVVVNLPTSFYLIFMQETEAGSSQAVFFLMLAANVFLGIFLAFRARETFPLGGTSGPPRTATGRAIGKVYRCPLCAKVIPPADVVACKECRTLFHGACFRDAGSCPTFRCKGKEALKVRVG